MAPRLVDHRGRPIAPAALTKTFAAPAMDAVHSVWQETVIAGLTPASMATVLQRAARGYPERFFTLAEEMEERDLHYGSVLGTRKRAITGVEPIVIAGGETALDKKLAEAVKALVFAPYFVDDYVTDLLDALGKGYAVVETIWDRSGREWQPKGYEWRDPRHFVIDQVDGRTLRFKDADSIEGIDLPPFQFSIHRPKLKSGLPIRGGLARMVAWAFLFKSYTLKDWMAFLEVYGMPLRVGKYGRGASTDDKRVLLQAVRDLSSDAAAIIPQEMTIDFVEASGGAGNAVFSSKAEYLDAQISKGVLGQTMTTDNGSSLSQAMVHENVRHDIAKADARQTAVTVNRDLVRPFIDLNFGPQDSYPLVVWPIAEAEDIKALADVLDRLVPLGLDVEMEEVRERIGFGAPRDDSVRLAPPQNAAPIPGNDNRTLGQRSAARLCAHCGESHAVLADDRDALDLLVDEALADWEADIGPLVAPIHALGQRAGDYSTFISGLEDLAAKLDGGPLADRLGKLLMKARGLGDTGEDL